MKRELIAVAALAATGLTLLTTSANSEDASWGCQVLLCAASQNPSWHGVGYCVPPMTRLISAMKKPGFSWPICHEANAGTPGYEAYKECPAGTTIGYSTEVDNGWQDEPNQCIKTVNLCQSSGSLAAIAQIPGATIRRSYNDSNDGCIQQIATPRPRRAEPYFFDLPNDEGEKERFWFNLND